MTTKRYHKVLLVLALLAVVASLFTGCGNSGDESQQGETQQSQDSQGGDDEPQVPDESSQSTTELKGDPSNMLQYKTPAAGTPIAVMQTSMGEIRIALYPEQAPKAVENFITHAEEDYYNGMIFHRVIKDFMVQTGDPTGTGSGGESVFQDENGNFVPFEDEFSDDLWHFRGALSMANPGVANYNQSQFFIVQQDSIPYDPQSMIDGGFPQDVVAAYVENGGTPHLDRQHTVFGMVISGMDVVDAIAGVKTDAYIDASGTEHDEPVNMQNAKNKPIEDVTIQQVTIEYAG